MQIEFRRGKSTIDVIDASESDVVKRNEQQIADTEPTGVKVIGF